VEPPYVPSIVNVAFPVHVIPLAIRKFPFAVIVGFAARVTGPRLKIRLPIPFPYVFASMDVAAENEKVPSLLRLPLKVTPVAELEEMVPLLSRVSTEKIGVPVPAVMVPLLINVRSLVVFVLTRVTVGELPSGTVVPEEMVKVLSLVEVMDRLIVTRLKVTPTASKLRLPVSYVPSRVTVPELCV
jgi:hypothetical protein